MIVLFLKSFDPTNSAWMMIILTVSTMARWCLSQPQLYGDLNERIVEQGEGATEELKDLAGKAEFIDNPPAFSRQSVRSNIFTFLNNLGINPENSEFVSNLLAGDP